MARKMKLALAAIAIAAVLSGCAANGGSSPRPSGGSTDALKNEAPVSIALFGSGPASGMERFAFTKGFAAKRGVQLKSTYDAIAGKEIVSSMLNGSAQFGSITTLATGPLVQQGECFRYLTAGERNIYDFIASPSLGLDDDKSYPQNLAALKGKKIGVSALGTLGEELAHYVLAEAGLKRDDVTFVATGGVASAIAAFQQGQVDATWSFAPMLQILDKDQYTKLTDFTGGSTKDKVIDSYVQHAFGTTCDYADAHPQVVKAVCQAVWDAYDYAAKPEHAKEMGDFFAKSLSLEPAVGEAFWKQYASTFPSPKISKSDWAALDAPEKALGVEQPSYSKYVDPLCAESDPR